MSETPKNPPPKKVEAASADLLADIDSTLIALLAVAFFSPTVRNSSASVRQVCAAEVLLYRLRAARRAVRELAEAYGIESPARRHSVAPVGLGMATPGGPGQTTGRGGEGPSSRGDVPPRPVSFSLPPRLGPDGVQEGWPPTPAPPPPHPQPKVRPAIPIGVGPRYDALRGR